MTQSKVNLKSLAINIFNIEEEIPAKCGGGHEICLKCHKCRAKDKDQLPDMNAPLASFIDHTNLKPEATRYDIKKLCKEADDNDFAAVCINPTNIFCASSNLEKADLCTVIGFPLGANTLDVKKYETNSAIEDGALELDMVINIGELKSKNYDFVQKEINELAKICHKNNAILKVIFENCLLNDTEIAVSSLLSKKAGADFVKTSTGFGSHGAKIEHVELMREVVGPKIGVKAAGGIRDKETTLKMLKAGANRIGASQGIAIING